ncbi:MAG: hypothetical protein MR924_13485 [Prevotella sp.]|nr:hypothetical protein [Prevotella sp.]
MKKLFTLLTAAAFVVGAHAQSEENIWLLSGNPGWGQCTVNRTSNSAENFQLNFRSQWSGFPIATNVSATDYKGVSIEYDCAINTAGVQITVSSKSGTQYNAAIESKTNEYSIYFNDNVKTDGTASSISIWQGGDKGKCDILVKKVCLIKSDDTKEQISSLPSDSWENSAYLSGVFNYKNQWNGAALKDDNSQNLTFSSALNQTHIYTVTLDEAATIDLTLLPSWEIINDEGKKTTAADYTHVIPNGQTSATFVFTPDYAKVPTNFALWTGVDKGFPTTVKVNSITRGIINHTSTAVANEGSTTYWGTYSNNLAAVELSGDGVEVYNVTLDADEKKLVFTKRADNKVAKGEGVIVKSNSASFNVAVVSDASAAAENLLKATPTTAQKIEGGDNTLYYLAFESKDSKKNLGFYWNAENGTSLKAVPGKAYLAIPSSKQLSLRRSIVIDDSETTVIESVKADRGQQDAIYNIAGQRVNKLSKGVNIVGNDKIIIK